MRVLVIDDNPDDRALVVSQIRPEFPDAVPVELADMDGFRRELAEHRPGLVITDYNLRWGSGMDILDQVKAVDPDCPVVMFTGTGSEEIAVEAMKRGLNDYVIKSPRQLPRLRASLRQVVENAKRRIDLRRAQEQLVERERELEEALAHKDLVLRELHHRVKNNLQTINSLLWMRARRAQNPQLKADLNEMAQRMLALAQVQARILDEERLDLVDFRAVLDDMISSLASVYADSHIRIHRDLEGELMLPVARAMPLGLMCYEILLNCFKHAFPDHQPGHLAVRLCRAGEHAEISISDDGIGYDEDTVSGGGMGTRLIRDLACEANVQVERLSRPNDGTSITLRVLHGGRS